MFWAYIIRKGVDEVNLNFILKFKTFGNISKELWHNMLIFLHHGQFG